MNMSDLNPYAAIRTLTLRQVLAIAAVLTSSSQAPAPQHSTTAPTVAPKGSKHG